MNKEFAIMHSKATLIIFMNCLDGELVLVDNFTEKDIMKVWFDSYCYGNELSLLDCYHFLGVDTFEECKANDYVGIKCFG